MNQLKHTEGPWNYSGPHKAGLSSDFFYVTNSQRTSVCQIGGDQQFFAPESFWERQANARLIAAAPDLLEMLYLALPYVEESDEFNKPTHKLGPKVRALLAKAKGEI